MWLFSTHSHCTFHFHVLSQRRPARRHFGSRNWWVNLRKGQALTKYPPPKKNNYFYPFNTDYFQWYKPSYMFRLWTSHHEAVRRKAEKWNFTTAIDMTQSNKSLYGTSDLHPFVIPRIDKHHKILSRGKEQFSALSQFFVFVTTMKNCVFDNG